MEDKRFFKIMQAEMNRVAVKIWNMVSQSREEFYVSSLSLGEVALTETAFYEMRHCLLGHSYFITDAKHESCTGADWEWLIGHDENWVSIRVQAKVLGTGTDNQKFPQLLHRFKNGTTQMEKLTQPDSGTVVTRWIPLYVFYVAAPPMPENCFKNANCGSLSLFGCSVVHARKVKDICDKANSSKTNAAQYLAEAVPWAQIFDGLISRLNKDGDFGKLVDALCDKPLSVDSRKIDDFWNLEQSDGTGSGQNDVGESANKLPGYVTEILNRERGRKRNPLSSEIREFRYFIDRLLSILVHYFEECVRNCKSKNDVNTEGFFWELREWSEEFSVYLILRYRDHYWDIYHEEIISMVSWTFLSDGDPDYWRLGYIFRGLKRVARRVNDKECSKKLGKLEGMAEGDRKFNDDNFLKEMKRFRDWLTPNSPNGDQTRDDERMRIELTEADNEKASSLPAMVTVFNINDLCHRTR